MTRVLATGGGFPNGAEAEARVDGGRSPNPRFVRADVRVDTDRIREQNPGFEVKSVFALVPSREGDWKKIGLEKDTLHPDPTNPGRETYLGTLPGGEDLGLLRDSGVAFGVEGKNGETLWLQDHGKNYGVSLNPYG